MILLWLKIIGYKIIKALRPRTHADSGEQTVVPRAHVETANGDAGVHVGVAVDPAAGDTGLVLYARQAGKNTILSARLRELIEKGLVYAPDSDGDLLRVQMFEADREARETRARLAHDPRECPCAGRHYPSPSACRWCRCHDPENLHHLTPEQVRALEDSMQVPPPRYDVHDLFGEAAHQLFGPIGPGVPDKLLAAGANPDQVEELRLALTGKRDPVTESSVRPAKEIVTCPGCGHPDHTPGDGRCAFQVASRMQDGGFSTCRCTVNLSRFCTLCTHDPHGAGACQAMTDDGAERCGCGDAG